MDPNIGLWFLVYPNGTQFVSLSPVCNPSIDFDCDRRWSTPLLGGRSLHRKFKVVSSDTTSHRPVIIYRLAIPWKLISVRCALHIFHLRSSYRLWIYTWGPWLLVCGLLDASSAWCLLLVWKPCFRVGDIQLRSLECMHRFVGMADRTSAQNCLEISAAAGPSRSFLCFSRYGLRSPCTTSSQY